MRSRFMYKERVLKSWDCRLFFLCRLQVTAEDLELELDKIGLDEREIASLNEDLNERVGATLDFFCPFILLNFILLNLIFS